MNIETIRLENEIYLRKEDVLRILEDTCAKSAKETPALDACYNHYTTAIEKQIVYAGLSKEEIKERRRMAMEVSNRYAVGKENGSEWLFYVCSVNGKPVFSNYLTRAKMYKCYKDAEACADFTDGCVVIDCNSALSENQRMSRALFGDPDVDDAGNDKAVPLS